MKKAFFIWYDRSPADADFLFGFSFGRTFVHTISHDSVRLQRHLQMMRSRNKIDALMVDDIHECRGSGRYRNRQIKHIVVDLPLHFRLAIWG